MSDRIPDGMDPSVRPMAWRREDLTPCVYCGTPVSWLREGDTVKDVGGEKMHSLCSDGFIAGGAA